MDCLNTLVSLNRAAHYQVMSSLISFMNKLVVDKKTKYLKEGKKYNLWKTTDRNHELKMLDKDLYKITKNTIKTLNDDNFIESMYILSNFIVTGSVVYLQDTEFDDENVQQSLLKLLEGHKDDKLKIWLRFYFRLKGISDQISKETEEALNYIG